MSDTYSEASYENSLMELFQGMGYWHTYGPDVERSYTDPLYEEVLEDSIRRINPDVPEEAIQEALYKLRNFDNGTLLQKNIQFMSYIQDGITVKQSAHGEESSTIVWPVDFVHPERNAFHVVNQWTFVERSEKRPDVVLFVNGLPLVVMELKSPSRENTDVSDAYRQLRNYLHEIPSLFIYNAVLVMSDQAFSRVGTITSGEDRFMEWKTVDGDYESTRFADFQTFFEGMFQKERLLDLLQNFICFNMEGTSTFKILTAYHQYFAVKKAVESTRRAMKTDGKGGVFWHTQGSGKSLSMVFYAHLLRSALKEPTIVVITDRNDLDDQLFGQFSRCAKFLKQEPVQAKSREHLRELLEHRKANGIIFTTMQKFTETEEALSDRHNIVVMADEAHRSQYGLDEHLKLYKNAEGKEEAKLVIGNARLVRNSLPNATYIGFTGTPISSKDKSTVEVFGNYIDVYDMTQAVEDGATRPVYYESRVIHLNLDPGTLRLIDEKYNQLAEDAEPYAIEKSKREMGQMEALLGADKTIDSLVQDILAHYEENRASLLTGKAMIVAYSREIAMKIYRRIKALRPVWFHEDPKEDKVAVVMTGTNNDPEDWKTIVGNKKHRDELASRFKDNGSPLKIAIVVDMWLTGFDVPSLATMYLYKPMEGHNLMQAIARVNRVFRDKEGGLVVDYIGIAAALKQAMNDYTKRDKSNYGEMDIAKQAYPKFVEQLEICRDLMHGFDYSGFMRKSDLVKGELITGAANFILDKDHKKQDQSESERAVHIFIREALMLHQALSLCSSMADMRQRMEAAFFEAVRVLVVRFTTSGSQGKKFSLNEINSQINNLLKQSIKSDGVINLFSNVEEGISLFDPKFLKEVSRMKQKNLAVEILKKLIADQVRVYRRSNVVKSEQFSAIIQRTLHAYLNGMLTNEKVIQELLDLAREMANAEEEGKALGLTHEEMAFYDALTRPQAVKDFYKHDELINLTRELTDLLRKNRTIDWQEKESARANMRRLVKRLLKKYKYPPEGMDDATKTVISQCEMWTDHAEDA